MAQCCLPGLQLLGQPLPAMGAAYCVSQVLGLGQDRTQVLPDEVVEGATRGPGM